jgi:hypothetical protein
MREFFADSFIVWYINGMPASALLEPTFNHLYFPSPERLSFEQASCVILNINEEPGDFCA